MTTEEMTDQSYYEIALTNRQVLMAFVVVLASVLGAFLSGVWVGKGGSEPLQAQEVQLADAATQGEGELESFRFFTDEEKKAKSEEAGDGEAGDGENRGKKRTRKPDLSRLLDDPDKATTLAEDVGSSKARKARRDRTPSAPPPKKAATETKKDPPKKDPPKKTAPPPPPPPPPPPAPTAAAEGFIVQVFSTHDEAQAQKVLKQVTADGYKGFITSEGTFYRVRIGPFSERAQADRASRGIKKKFKLDTWVTAASN